MDENMKVYTRTGDSGQTSLIGGMRVPKDHPRIEAYGTLDELNSFLGLAHDYLDDPSLKKDIQKVQDVVFVVESHLASSTEEATAYLPAVPDSSIGWLEERIDQMESELPPLRNFILPGGHLASSVLHVARTVCRRAERLVIALDHNEPVNPLIVRYLNRLSDYLFVLARYVAFQAGAKVVDWVPNH